MQCDTLEYDEVQNYMQFHSLNFFYLGHVMTKPVFGLRETGFSARETSRNLERLGISAIPMYCYTI